MGASIMFDMPQYISITADNIFFKNVSNKKEDNVLLKESTIVEFINNTSEIDAFSIQGSQLRISHQIWSGLRKNVRISLDCENKDVSMLSNFKKLKQIYQIRFSFFLNELVSNFETINKFKKIINDDELNKYFEYKVIVIYVYKHKLNNLSKLQTLVKIAFEKGFFVSIFPVPKSILKSEYILSNEEYRGLSAVVDSLINKYGRNVYGEFPTMGLIYDNLIGICPSHYIKMNITPEFKLTPCRFVEKPIGNINNSIKTNWNIWQAEIEKVETHEICKMCSVKKYCNGGCISNWNSNSKIDTYCIHTSDIVGE